MAVEHILTGSLISDAGDLFFLPANFLATAVGQEAVFAWS
jgi:hypothetical protein